MSLIQQKKVSQENIPNKVEGSKIYEGGPGVGTKFYFWPIWQFYDINNRKFTGFFMQRQK